MTSSTSILNLGHDQIVERDITPLTIEEATVFNDQHPAPVKDEETEKSILLALDKDLSEKNCGSDSRHDERIAERVTVELWVAAGKS